MKLLVTKFVSKILTVFLAVSLVWPVSIYAYFSHNLVSENYFTAGQITLNAGVVESVAVVSQASGSFATEFGLTHDADNISSQLFFETTASGTSAFCGSLEVQVPEVSLSGSVSGAAAGPETPTPGLHVMDIEFDFDSSSTTSFLHGTICEVTMLIETVQTDILPTGAGFYDEELLTWQVMFSNIVLNEVLADPASGQKEFIELFNNGDEDIDVAGWKISELAGSNEVLHTIKSVSSAGADLIAYDNSGSTVVPAGGHLALKFAGNSSYLNNSADTVTLYDADSNLLDAYTYNFSLAGKSDARIPDGVGDWIDPIPTPGEPNRLPQIVRLVVKKTVDVTASSSVGTTTSSMENTLSPESEILGTTTASTTDDTDVETESDSASSTESGLVTILVASSTTYETEEEIVKKEPVSEIEIKEEPKNEVPELVTEPEPELEPEVEQEQIEVQEEDEKTKKEESPKEEVEEVLKEPEEELTKTETL